MTGKPNTHTTTLVSEKFDTSLLSIIVCQVFHSVLIVILKGFIYLFPISEDITTIIGLWLLDKLSLSIFSKSGKAGLKNSSSTDGKDKRYQIIISQALHKYENLKNLCTIKDNKNPDKRNRYLLLGDSSEKDCCCKGIQTRDTPS